MVSMNLFWHFKTWAVVVLKCLFQSRRNPYHSLTLQIGRHLQFQQGKKRNEFKLLDMDSYPGNTNYTPIPAKMIMSFMSVKEGTTSFFMKFNLSGDMFFLPAG